MKGLKQYISEMGIFDIDANIESNAPIEEEFKEWCERNNLVITKRLRNGKFDIKCLRDNPIIDDNPPADLINTLSTGARKVTFRWTEEQLKNYFPKATKGTIRIKSPDMTSLDWFRPGTKIAGTLCITECPKLERISNDLGKFGIFNMNCQLQVQYCVRLKSLKGMRLECHAGSITFQFCDAIKDFDWEYLHANFIFFYHCGFKNIDEFPKCGKYKGELCCV